MALAQSGKLKAKNKSVKFKTQTPSFTFIFSLYTSFLFFPVFTLHFELLALRSPLFIFSFSLYTLRLIPSLCFALFALHFTLN